MPAAIKNHAASMTQDPAMSGTLAGHGQTLYLIDGSGFIFRAYHALPQLTAPDGTPSGAVLGFCNMLARLLNETKPTAMAVIFDAARKTFRHDIYTAYKANRPEAPEDLIPQFPLVREAARAFNLPAIEQQGYEADDLIASYTREALAQGYQVRIVSSDKDLMQLIRDGVRLLDPIKYKILGPDDVMEKFGVMPEKVIDVQALAGDSTDNVPGVPGIGVKTAAELINQFGSLEDLLRQADTIKQPKRRQALIENAEMARISGRLVRLDDHAPLPEPISTFAVHAPDPALLTPFLERLGFRALITRLNLDGRMASITHNHAVTGLAAVSASSAAPQSASSAVAAPIAVAPAAHDYTLITDSASLTAWLADLEIGAPLAIDTETTSLTPSTTTLVGISLAKRPGAACYIPLNHKTSQEADGQLGFAPEQPTLKQLSLADAVRLLKPILADPSVLKVGHNLKFDMQVLAQHGLFIDAFDDTMLLSYVCDCGLHGHGLDELSETMLGHKMISYDEVTGTGKARITFDYVPLARALDYAAEDADYTLRLWLALKPRLPREKANRIYERCERPLVAVVADMETAGVLIDAAFLRELSNKLAQRQAVFEQQIHALAGQAFNVGSPKQLGDVLFGALGLPGGVKGKTGAYGTSADILEDLAAQGHEIAERVLDWRGVAKLKSTYTDALPEQIDARTGRVHTSFSLAGTNTGRLSSTDPNLQNIPIRTEDGRAIRRAFIAAPGHVLLSADYSQIELRLIADIAGIPALKQAFLNNLDIHAATASEVFGVPLAEITSDLRRQAKAINFGIIYGISGWGLARQLGCDQATANSFIKQYFARFPELKAYMERAKEEAREHGYVTTRFGRRCHINGITDKNQGRRGFAERQAINAPVQGTAADIMKLAMIAMPQSLKAAGLSARMLLQVHDELLFEVPVTEAEATATLVKSVMEKAPNAQPETQFSVPFIVEAHTALNWAEAH